MMEDNLMLNWNDHVKVFIAMQHWGIMAVTGPRHDIFPGPLKDNK